MHSFRLRFFLLLILCSCLVVDTTATAEPPPRWPLDLPTRYLTSGFMEYRPGRYHAGLDLKTQGRTGFAVHAAEDGSIVRVRATARAYGRAVYLQTPAGKTYVYAHLARFNDVLRAKIDQARRKSGRYRAELYFKPGAITIGRGDVLGLTGQSGTAGPHLHFEVRDAAQRPLNPLAHGFVLPDTFPPVIYAVHAVPMTVDATVGGRRQIMVCGRPDAEALPDTLPPLAIDGPVAFTARVVDHADIRGYRLEPELIRVLLDGQEVFRARNSTFAFDQGSCSRLEWYEGFSPRERWLHHRRGDDVPGREGGPWPLGPAGRGLAPGAHSLVIEAVDHAGGRDRVVLPLQVGEGAQAAGWRPDSLAVPAGVPDEVVAGCLQSPFFSPDCAAEGWTVTTLDPDAGDPVYLKTRLLSRPAALPMPTLLRAQDQYLTPASAAGIFLAADWPIESAVPVALPADSGFSAAMAADGDFARIYRWNGRDWSGAYPLEAGPDGPGFMLGAPGLYAVFLDHAAPVLSAAGAVAGALQLGPGPRPTVPGVTPPRWEVFPVVISEGGSGVDPASITATLDGRPFFPEPDLPRSRLLVELPADTPAGVHDLKLTLRDRCGNEASCDLVVTCGRAGGGKKSEAGGE